MPKRGAFIVIEGLDRSGKSTQAETLLRSLQDAQVSAKLIKFPGQHFPWAIDDSHHTHTLFL